MKAKDKYLLLKTVQQNNILPVTSICNMNCLFCSHHFNPPGIETYRYGTLSLDLIIELIEYLSPGKPVVLGESATKIIEGEPFSHPQIYAILSALRRKWPRKKIKITTNGSFLTANTIQILKDIGNIKLNISLNCANPDERYLIMKDKNPERVFAAFALLDKYSIPYEGSIVALPHVMGRESIAETISFLSDYQTETVRIFLPGFTHLTPEEYQFPPGLYTKLMNFITQLNNRYELPLILEPPLLKDFSSRIIGIISDTPAAKAGLRKGDVIIEINGIKPQTRVESFNLLNKFQSLSLKIKRGDKVLSLTFDKEKDEKTGIVLNYDLSPQTIKEIKRVIQNTEAKNILIITSEFGQYLIKIIMDRINNTETAKNINCIVAKNYFFGGSIKSAGLLVNSDIIQSIQKVNSTVNPGLIILPGIIYDLYGNDLTGSGFHYLEEKLATDIKIIN